MDKEKLKEFVAFLKGKTALKSEELLEKDFYIGAFLNKIAGKEYAFKGGTCLSKVYLNYHRISEDIDFTFINQGIFKGKNTGQIKKICSEKTTLFGRLLENISKEYDSDFKLEKGNKRYVELGSNSKLATFKIWYRSAFTGAESFVKIQITFLETIKFPVTVKAAKPLIDAGAFSETDRIYYSDYASLYKPLKCRVYDLREIASEKVRALLTRRNVKARDIVDLYFICKMHISLGALKETCVEKVIFAVRSYEKYKKNILTKAELSEKDIPREYIEHLMLANVGSDFDAFSRKLFGLLEEIKAEVFSLDEKHKRWPMNLRK